MRNLVKLLFQRVVLVSLGILLQVVALVSLMTWLTDWRQWVEALMGIVRIAAVLYLVSSRTNPSYKIAWIILILTFPIAGISIYLFVGGNRLSRRERHKMSRLTAIIEDNLTQDPDVAARLAALCPAAACQSRYLASSAMSPVFENTQTEYFSCGEDCFKRMLEVLRNAEKFIFLEYFIIEKGKMWNAILEILKKKAAAGVTVRLIYDDFGCITRLPMHYARELRDCGIQTMVFNPFVPIASGRLNNRDHRKLMIVDGVFGFTGGINLADEYINEVRRFGHWKDCGILLRGSAVWSMTIMFLSMWNYMAGRGDDLALYLPEPREFGGRGFVQPFSDSPLDSEDVGETLLLGLISRAEKSVYVMTPYLIIDDKMVTALTTAAKSGLDVRIITPGIPDKKYVYSMTRANYPALTAAGCRIFEYIPGFIHSKVVAVDGAYAVVGTVNLDFRSLYLHFEDGVFLYEADCVGQVDEDFRKTFPLCREVTDRMARSVPLPVRLGRTLLHLFAPLM